MVRRKVRKIQDYKNEYDKYVAVSTYLASMSESFEDTKDEVQLKNELEFLLGVLSNDC